MKNILYLSRTTLLISYFIFHISYFATAQPNRDQYRDKVWVFGYGGQAQVQGYGTTLLTFNNSNIDSAFFFGNMNISSVSTSLCDTAGNLVMYSNGIYIADKTHQKMINGDSLDYGQHWQTYQALGSEWIQGGISILPIPTVKNSSVVLYHDIELLPSGGYFRKGLKAAFINLNKNNGKGVVLQKDIQIFNDTMYGVLATVCRHANGRDWWIIGIKYGMGKYYKTLLTPQGLIVQVPQIMPYLSSAQSTGKVAYFSPNGKKYAHYSSGSGTYLYDFDRCTGELSNRQLIPLFRAYRTPFCGIAFSPNSRYLYVTDDGQIVQYDTQAPTISASGIVVAEYDGFSDGGFANTAFFLLQLAPNGKIYGNCTGSNHYLHIIHNPNERGLACNVEQHGLRLPTWYDSTMPNFPNFRLGSEPGTVCDSLGIETGVTDTLATHAQNPKKMDFQLSISPNPTSSECTISMGNTINTLLLSKGKLSIYAADGRLLETFSNPFLNQNNFTINLKNYAKGVYIVEYEGVRTKVVRQ